MIRHCGHCKSEQPAEAIDKEYSVQTDDYIVLYRCDVCKKDEWEFSVRLEDDEE